MTGDAVVDGVVFVGLDDQAPTLVSFVLDGSTLGADVLDRTRRGETEVFAVYCYPETVEQFEQLAESGEVVRLNVGDNVLSVRSETEVIVMSRTSAGSGA